MSLSNTRCVSFLLLITVASLSIFAEGSKNEFVTKEMLDDVLKEMQLDVLKEIRNMQVRISLRLVTARIRRMGEGTVFSLFVSSHPGGVPHHRSG